jgi:hypothetical protein
MLLDPGKTIFERFCFWEVFPSVTLSPGNHTFEVRVVWNGGSAEKSFPFTVV